MQYGSWLDLEGEKEEIRPVSLIAVIMKYQC